MNTKAAENKFDIQDFKTKDTYFSDLYIFGPPEAFCWRGFQVFRPASLESMNSLVKLSPEKRFIPALQKSSSPQFCQSPIISFMVFFWPVIKHGFPPAHKPTPHRRSQRHSGVWSPNRASFNKNVK